MLQWEYPSGLNVFSLTASKALLYSASFSWLKMQYFAKKSTAKREKGRRRRQRQTFRVRRRRMNRTTFQSKRWLFCSVYHILCRAVISSLSNNIRLLCVSMCVCAEWIRAIFLSSGRTRVMEGGQYRASGSQGVQLALIGGGGGTWLLNRAAVKTLKLTIIFCTMRKKVSEYIHCGKRLQHEKRDQFWLRKLINCNWFWKLINHVFKAEIINSVVLFYEVKKTEYLCVLHH